MPLTPVLKIPYPAGTDRVMDGDNAMQAIADRVEARLPWGWVAYAQVTANQSVAGTVDLTGLTVTFTAVAGRRYAVSSGASWLAGTAGTFASLVQLDGAAQLSAAAVPMFTTWGMTTLPSWSGPLSAGAHTLKLRGVSSGGTATMQASATDPAWLLVEDIGPTVLT